MAKDLAKLKLFTIILLGINLPLLHADSKDWHLDAAPYFWAINMNGTTGAADYTLDLKQNFGEILQQFQGGGMLWLALYNKYFGVFANLLYSELSQTNTIENVELKIRNQFGVFSYGINYTLAKWNFYNTSSFDINFLAGARTTINNVKLSIPSFSIKNDQDWTDPLFGLKFGYLINPEWEIIILGDGGGVNNHYSYDFQGYLGYKPKYFLGFSCIDFYLGYRLLHQYYSTGSGESQYLWDMNIFGPLIGVKIEF